MHSNTTQFYAKYKWLMLLAISVILIIIVNPSSLFFLNDDFDSLPVYGQGQFMHRRGMRFFVQLSLYSDYRLYGNNAWGYILTNLLIHISCCAAGFIWCKKMVESFHISLNQTFVFFGILLFMWFAFHSEAVFWAISRTASVGLLCFFGTWFCFFKTTNRKWWLALAFVIMLCGLFSYETLLLLPLQLLIWHWLLPENSVEKKQTTWNVIIILTAIAVYLPVRRYITLEWVGSYEAKEIYAFSLFSLAKNYVSLLLRTFVPPMQHKLMAAAIGSMFILLAAAMSFIIFRIKKADKWWWFLLLNWLMSYVLFTSLGIDMSGYESERYLYVASFFFSIWLVYSLSLLKIRNTFKYIAFTILLAYHIFFFSSALQQFRKAGQLAKDILATINNNSITGTKEKTIIKNLPDKAYGIPLFRLGVKNGLKWFYPQYDTSRLILRSKLLNAGYIHPDETLFQTDQDSINNTVVITFFPSKKKDNE